MLPIKKYIMKPALIHMALKNRWLRMYRLIEPIMSDEEFLKIIFPQYIGRKLNIVRPKTFNEKLQWLKLHDRNPEHTILVDKFAVKEFIADTIGEQYVIPTLGIYQSFDDINFEDLPDCFVLKTTHGGGGNGVVICKDKKKFDKHRADKTLSRNLKDDISRFYKEWPYKNVPRRIIVEPYITDNSGDLKDYKFFCFNGVPKFLKVDFGRFKEHHANYYDLDWNLLPFGEVVCPPDFSHKETQPDNFDKMVENAQKLSSGHYFVRVDLYNVDGRILFGELTFFPASGFGKFMPQEWDEKIGAFLHLPVDFASEKS